MVYSLKGKLISKQKNDFVVGLGGLGLKINSSFNVLKNLPEIGKEISVFTHLHVREDALELYGFLDKKELELFEMLVAISGIGPKSALGILGVEKIANLKAAIGEGRAELLTKASGIGRKTAERIVLELKSKLKQEGAGKIVGVMEGDQDILEALVNLGYKKAQAKEALGKVSSDIAPVEERIKAALKILKNV